MTRLLVAALLLLLPSLLRAQDWEPARTHVLVVGLLEWKDTQSFASFPKTNRRDAQLVEFFRERGVPRRQIVYLQDRQATTKAAEAALATMIDEVGRGDLLLVYYCGHGFRDDSGKTFFATWDAGAGSPGWNVASITAATARVRGARVILAADCCHSGALATTLPRTTGAVGVLASSTSSESSTGNWTFTEALLDGLRGARWVDADGDGSITFAETAQHVRDDMRFAEEQRATSVAAGGFPDTFALATSTGSRARRLGDRVDVDWNGQRFKGRVIAVRGGSYQVHYFGYEASDDEWVDEGRLHEARTATGFPVGTKVDVSWQGRWYAATVLARDGASHHVHYDGWADSWDEWVPSARVRARTR